jgi:CheY-like chemotaxis protein
MAHILVVDDDEVTRQALHEALTDEGHEVAELMDGQAALDFLCTTPHHWVVLLDYLLQGGSDGRVVLAAMATDSPLAGRHACIAIAATPKLDAPAERLRRALGVPLLPKPCDADELLAAIAQAEARLRG